MAACALFAGGVSASADELDITSLYLTNPSFETGDWTGWTTQTAEDTWVRDNNTAGKDGTYLFNTWWHGYPISQTVKDLPAGSYTLSALAASTGGWFSIFVNDATSTEISKATVNPTDGDTFISCSTNFTIETAQDVTVGVRNSNTENTYDDAFWFKTDNFKLVLNLEEGATIPNAIVTKLLEAVPSGTMSTSVESALNATVSTFESNATLSNYNALLTAIDAANTSIASYAAIAAGTISTSAVSGWTISTTNGELACNTWSTEGNTDGSGMTTPFIQDWIGSGTALGAGKLYYRLEGLNPDEKYSVSALVRVLDESGAAVSGATFYANDETKDIAANGSACTNGIAGTMNLAAEVDEDGVLEIGIESSNTSTFNWIAIKNVTIAEYAGIQVSSITLDKTSAALTTGDALTLNATVSPDNADDKTFTWASSNDAVATVTAAGIVTALSAGSATITATANDGSGVSASCAVSVANAATPANYSSIAEGTFYIRNVATGKFLGQGNGWDTQASLIKHGKPITVTASNGKYKLTNIVKSGAGLGSDGYSDNGSPVELTITETSTGSGIYTIAYGETLTAASAGTTVVSYQTTDASNALAQWQFLSYDDMQKNLSTTLDATFYVTGALAQRTASSNSAWTSSNVETNYSGTLGYANAYICSESYHKENFSYTQTVTVPNGTYNVSVQGFNSGSSEAYLVANDEKVLLRAQSSESHGMTCNSRTTAAKVFEAGYYPNTVEVTVTDHTLTLGVSGSSANCWVAWNNFELEMTEYLPVTALAATFDVDDDDETEGIQIEEGKTGNISVTMTPTPASFDALTYTSSDETVATVTDAGVVTAVAAGTATITIAAEMENVTTTLAINVVEPAVVPATIALTVNDEEVDEILLDGSDLTATLTATVGPDGAPQAVTWTSSDETVATVADGIITGISTGTATITATSSVNGEVSASVTVNVFMFANGSFENSAAGTALTNVQKSTTGSALTMYGWTETVPGTQWNDTQIYNSSTANSSAFGTKVNPTNGNYYLFFRQSWNGSSTNDMTLTTGTMTLPIGKYTISYDYMLAESTDGSHTSSGTTLTLSALDSESATLNSATVSAALNPGSSYFTTDANWASSSFVLTLTEETTVSFKLAMTPRGGVRSDMCVDNFAISYENIKEALPSMIADVTIPTANVGTGAFQISSTAVATLSDAVDDAQAVYDNAETTDAQAIAAIEALEDAVEAFDATPLNAPTAGKTYNIINNSTGYNYAGNAVTFKSASDADLTGNTTSMGYNEAPGSIYPQGVTFTAVDGVLNGYKLSYTRADGNTVYVGTGASVGYVNNGNNNQIRPTTDPLKSVTIQVVATTTEGVWNLYNTLASQNIGANGANDQGFFTVGNYNSMTLQEATNNEVALNITAANQYGSLILPFNAEIPTGVTAYSVSEAEGNTLTLVEKDAFEANTPYIVFAEEGISTTLAGLGAAYTDATYTDGLLTGTYTQIAAPNESYILQNQDGKVGFYQVNTEVATPNVPANRAYLTAPANARPAAFFFDSEATGINAINALSNGEAEIYNQGGVKQNKLQKGMNIIRSNGKTYKVVVK